MSLQVNLKSRKQASRLFLYISKCLNTFETQQSFFSIRKNAKLNLFKSKQSNLKCCCKILLQTIKFTLNEAARAQLLLRISANPVFKSKLLRDKGGEAPNQRSVSSAPVRPKPFPVIYYCRRHNCICSGARERTTLLWISTIPFVSVLQHLQMCSCNPGILFFPILIMLLFVKLTLFLVCILERIRKLSTGFVLMRWQIGLCCVVTVEGPTREISYLGPVSSGAREGESTRATFFCIQAQKFQYKPVAGITNNRLQRLSMTAVLSIFGLLIQSRYKFLLGIQKLKGPGIGLGSPGKIHLEALHYGAGVLPHFTVGCLDAEHSAMYLLPRSSFARESCALS